MKNFIIIVMKANIFDAFCGQIALRLCSIGVLDTWFVEGVAGRFRGALTGEGRGGR